MEFRLYVIFHNSTEPYQLTLNDKSFQKKTQHSFFCSNYLFNQPFLKRYSEFLPTKTLSQRSFGMLLSNFQELIRIQLSDLSVCRFLTKFFRPVMFHLGTEFNENDKNIPPPACCSVFIVLWLYSIVAEFVLCIIEYSWWGCCSIFCFCFLLPAAKD